jgi:hypothetical protein
MDDKIGGSSEFNNTQQNKNTIEKDSDDLNLNLDQYDKRIVLVSIKVLDNQVDLFDKEFRDHDSKF